MKRSTKILALLLAVLMLGSVVSIASVAAEDPYASLKEGIGYVAIGDSFTRGFGANDNFTQQIYNNEYQEEVKIPGTDIPLMCIGRNVDGSYPNRIAEKFGLDAPNNLFDTNAKLWPLSHDAVSTAYVLDLLGIDDGFRDDEFTYQDGPMRRRYEFDLRYYGAPESYTLDGQARYGANGTIMNVREMLANASLISLGLGQTDIVYKAQVLGLNKLDLNDKDKLPAGIADIISRLYKYYDYWKVAYPMLLDFIKEVNPDAKVVLVGTLNPIKDATYSDDNTLPLGSAINIISDLINSFTRQCALKYGYMFVDISDVETPPSIKQMSVNEILSMPRTTQEEEIAYALIAHPTQKGYEQIANKMITAIERSLQADVTNGSPKKEVLFSNLFDWIVTFFSRMTTFLQRIIAAF